MDHSEFQAARAGLASLIEEYEELESASTIDPDPNSQPDGNNPIPAAESIKRTPEAATKSKPA